MIITCGKSKTMVGQMYKNAQSSGIDISERDSIDQKPIGGSPNVQVSDSGNSANNPSIENPPQSKPAIQQPPASNNLADTGEQVETKETRDISKIVTNSLGKWGWPLRLVGKYKKNMVKQKLTPNGAGGINKQITVTAPNTYYGTEEIISDDDFSSLVKSIESFAKITWLDADRSGDVMTISFSSNAVAEYEDPAEKKLDSIYGKQPGAAKGKKATAATLSELILARKDELYNILRNIANKGNQK